MRNARVAGAALLPVVGLDGSVTRSRSSQSTGTGDDGHERRPNAQLYSASLTASYEIDFWGKNRAALRAAEELAAASRFDREVVALTTVVSVANAYFQVLVGARPPARRARQPRSRDARLNLVKERFNAGTASALDTVAAGKPGQQPARLDPAAGADSAAEHRARSRC